MKTILALLTILVAVPATSAQDAGSTWLDLFGDGTFSAWTLVDGSAVGPGWSLEDGVVHRSGDNAGDIVTRTRYEDFELRFEWKVSEAGNSGVKYRAKGQLGLEYQILDDSEHPDRQNPTHRAASLYDLVATPDAKPLMPVGEWNRSRIVARGGLLEHWLNGTQVVSIDQSSADWTARFEKSKYRGQDGFGIGAGKILLQDHGDEVWFRRLRIKSLSD